MSVGTLMIAGAGVALAGANGANDNAKGVATLVGARSLTRDRALWFGHLATFAGALAALFLSTKLLRTFQGSGLLRADLAGTPAVLGVVAAAAAVLVLAATRFRIPVSTTHALTGALVGTSLGATGSVAMGPLANKFLLPLLVSPLISAALACAGYLLLHRARVILGVRKESCVCVHVEGRSSWVPVAALAQGGAIQEIPSGSSGAVAVEIGDESECRTRYRGSVLGVSAGSVLDSVHVFSAGGVSLARGLNDTPKLAALMAGIAAGWTGHWAIAVVALAMLGGGWLGSRRVMGTMSERITEMNPGSATTANLVAFGLVTLASFVAMPVSTTHVTCGALFGIGLAQGRAHWRTVGGILVAWVLTLPLAAGVAAALAWFFLASAS